MSRGNFNAFIYGKQCKICWKQEKTKNPERGKGMKRHKKEKCRK